jgi:hypothetical protein
MRQWRRGGKKMTLRFFGQAGLVVALCNSVLVGCTADDGDDSEGSGSGYTDSEAVGGGGAGGEASAGGEAGEIGGWDSTACAMGLDACDVSDEAMVRAGEIYANRCQTCHGENGLGDGPAAAALNPQPRDFTSPDWKNAASGVAIADVILGGGEAMGLSPLMPPNPDLGSDLEVVYALVLMILGD